MGFFCRIGSEKILLWRTLHFLWLPSFPNNSWISNGKELLVLWHFKTLSNAVRKFATPSKEKDKKII